jgi:hypothetical protein
MAGYRHRTMRQMRACANAPALPPLVRLWRAQVTGVRPQFAPHEVHRIPQTKRASPVSGETHNGFSNVSGEGEYQARRSQMENSLDTTPAERVANLLQRHMLRHRTDCADRSRRVPVAVIARMADVSRETAYQAARGRMSETTRKRLSAVLSWIESGELRFFRRGQVWEGDYRTPPDPLPPPQDRAVRVEDWNEWACCRSCGGRWFSRVVIPGRGTMYVCDNCLPQSQWSAIGARPSM